MRTKVTFVLIFLNAVLFFFIFHFERNWRTERMAMQVRRRVLGAEAADIRSLDVVSTVPGGSFSLERRGQDWFLTKPFGWRANLSAVSRIINDLQFLEHETSFSVGDVEKSGQSLVVFGLDRPKLTLTFTSGGPDTTGGPPVTTTLRIGSTTKVGHRLYLLSSDGERIHVVDRELADHLSIPPDQLRDASLLTIPVFEARSLNLQTAAPADLHIRIRRDGSRWLFETPILALANKDAIDRAINGLDALRASAFVAANPSLPPPAEAPVLRVTLEGDKRHETLFVGQPASAGGDEYYAQLEGRAELFTVLIPAGLMDTLRNAQETLRDRHVLDFDPHAVTVITLAAPYQPSLILQRDLPDEKAAGAGGEPRWQIVLRGDGARGPQTLPADSAAVQRLLDQLPRLSVERFQSDAPQASDLENWGFNSPERTITLVLAVPRSAFDSQASGANSQLSLQLGLPTHRDGSVYARLGNATYVYAVTPDILRETSVAPSAWRERLLRTLPGGAKIVALKLTDLSADKVILDWSASASVPPGGTAADSRPAIPAIVEQLRALRARRFKEEAFSEKVNIDGEERPWKYRLDATIALPGSAGAEPTHVSTLWFADRSGGSEQVVGSRELNAVFYAEQPLIDAFWTLTYGGRDPGPPSP